MQAASGRIGKTSMGPSSPKAGTPAPYGHACTNCAKAKCKCIHRVAGGPCERCFRLSKNCQPSVPNRKRNPRKAPGSRTAHLEEKLDDLVSLIRSQAGQRNPSLSAAAAALEETGVVGASSSSGSGIAAGAATAPSTSSNGSTPASSTQPLSSDTYRTEATSPGAASPAADFDFPIADDDAEARLAVFTGQLSAFFGVVYLPPGTTAQELRRTRPFLWLSIMACTSRSLKQAHVIGDKVRQAIAAKVMVGQDRNLDVLQGMLVYLFWPHCHRKERPFLTLWTNLCMSIVQDLGYISAKGESAFSYIKKFWMQSKQQTDQGVGCNRTQNSERSMDERRTLLGLYVWTSIFSEMTGRENTLPWTPLMEACLRTLMTTPECDGDLILTTHVRCALVTQQIIDMSIQQSVIPGARTSIMFHGALNSQLQDIWRTIPPSVSRHDSVLLALYATQINVNELAVNFEHSTSNVSMLKRLEALEGCLKALEDWLQIWDRLPAKVHLSLTFLSWIQLIHAIVAVFKLSIVDNIPAWSPAEVRARLDLLPLLDRLADQLALSDAALNIIVDDPGEETIWTKSARILRMIKRGIQQDYPSLGPAGGVQVATVPGGTAMPGQSQDLQDPFLANYGDDPWLSAIFVPWDSMNF